MARSPGPSPRGPRSLRRGRSRGFALALSGGCFKWSSRVTAGTSEGLRGARSGPGAGVFRAPHPGRLTGRSRGRTKAVVGAVVERAALGLTTSSRVSSTVESAVANWAAFRPSRNSPDRLHAVSTQGRATGCDSRLRTRREARRLRDMRMAEERRRARSRKWPSEPTIKHLPASAIGRTTPRRQPSDALRGFAKPDFPARRALLVRPLGARQAVKACVQRR